MATDAAEQERERLDRQAAAERERLDREAAAARKRLDDEAAALRKKLDQEAAAERKRLYDQAANEAAEMRKRLVEEAAALLQQLKSIGLALQGKTITEPTTVVVSTQPSAAANPERSTTPAVSVTATGSGAASLEENDAAVQEQRRKEREAAAAATAAAAAAAAVAAAAAAAAATPVAVKPVDPAEEARKAAEAARRKAEAEAVEKTWKEEDFLAGIVRKAAKLEELPENLLDLHDGMPPVLRQAPMRLIKVDALLRWPNLRVYEEVDVEKEAVVMPYEAVGNDLWNSTLILSWRWNAVKPAEQVAGFSPMSELQWAEFTLVLKRAQSEGIKYAWVDWCCVPQYCSSPMVEVLRSKVFYLRARAMTVIPTFHDIPTEGIVRLLLVKAGRVIKKRAATSIRAAIVAARLESMLAKSQVAGREYFSRVWTLAERMARHGRPEQLCNWLSLEAWLGMLVDAMLKSTDDRTASAIYKRILGTAAGEALDQILDPLENAVRTGSMHVSEGLEDRVAELFEMAVGIWHMPRELAEAPTREWLMSYLLEANTGIYQAWSDADRIWSVYSYFCWKQLDQQSEAGLLEALRDLVQVAGGGRKHLVCMATKLGLGKLIPPSDVDRQLAAAAEANNTAQIMEALSAGASPDTPGSDGGTALWFAANAGNVEIVQLLLNMGADLNLTNTAKVTPLNAAALAGHTEVVRILIKAGAKLDVAKQAGGTELHSACEKGHEEIVRLLLEAGAQKEALDVDKVTPLYVACVFGHLDIVRALLDAGANKEHRHPNGRTPIGAAAQKGRAPIVKLLAHAGANKEALATEYKFTPMHSAAFEGHAAVVQALLDAGANKDAMSQYGTPLHRAARGGHLEAVKVLLAAKVHMDSKDLDQKQTALMTAAINCHEAVVKELISKGAGLEVEDKDGWRAIHYASKGNHVGCVRALINAGAALKIRTKAGNWPYDLTKNKKIRELLPAQGILKLF